MFNNPKGPSETRIQQQGVGAGKLKAHQNTCKTGWNHPRIQLWGGGSVVRHGVVLKPGQAFWSYHQNPYEGFVHQADWEVIHTS